MAGVKCEHCGELMQGKIKSNSVIGCITCKKQFRVTPELMSAYENEKEKSVWDYIRRYLIMGAFIIIGFPLAIIFMTNSPFSNSSKPQQDAEAFFSGWDGANKELVTAVKAGMHDPKSFEHVETRYTDKGNSFGILMTFRGTNGFGAVVTQQVTADIDKQSRQLSNLKQT